MGRGTCPLVPTDKSLNKDIKENNKAHPPNLRENNNWLRWLGRILLIAAIPVPIILSIYTKEISFSNAIIISCIFLIIAGVAWFFPLIGGSLGLIFAAVYYYYLRSNNDALYYHYHHWVLLFRINMPYFAPIGF
jgi:hypothetical protein